MNPGWTSICVPAPVVMLEDVFGPILPTLPTLAVMVPELEDRVPLELGLMGALMVALLHMMSVRL